MSKSKIIKLDMTKLQKFAAGINHMSDFRVAVGIMGSKTYRANFAKPTKMGKGSVAHKGKFYERSSGLTNADIGFKHEFGDSKTPKRSFLRMPLFVKADQILKEVKEAGALKQLARGEIVQVFMNIGVAAEKAILEAFDSAGFGSWKDNAASTIIKKGSDTPLIDTGQLRRSISSAVVKV